MQRLLLSVVLIALRAALLGQAVPHDAESTVRQALAYANGGYTSTTEKELARLGDASAVAITKVVAGKPLGEQDVEHMLLIITLSYSGPRVIEASADRNPRTTLLLLNYFDLAISDPKLKAKVATTRAYVKGQYAKWLKEGDTARP